MQPLYDLLKRAEREYNELKLTPIDALPWDVDATLKQDALSVYQRRI